MPDDYLVSYRQLREILLDELPLYYLIIVIIKLPPTIRNFLALDKLSL